MNIKLLTTFGLCLTAGALGAVLTGCTPAPAQVVVTNGGAVPVQDGSAAVGELPATINLADKRIGVALAAIHKHLGVEVRFEVDSTLVPKFDERLHEAFVEGLETIVTSLDYVQRNDPEVLSYAGPHLQVVRFIYSPSRRRETPVELDTTRDILEIPVPADEWRLVEDSLIATVFDAAWEKEKDRRYTHSPAAEIPVAEHEYYLDYLRGYHRLPPGATKADQEVSEINRLGQELELYPLLRDPELRKKAQASLANAGRALQSWFADLPTMPELAQALKPVHVAWVKWLNQEHTKLTDVQVRELSTLLFTYHYKSTVGFGAGLDMVSFATPRIRSWIERSKTEQNGYGAEDGANDMVLCPAEYDVRDHSFSSPHRSCNGALYTTLAQQTPKYQRLIALLKRENWPAFTQTATLSLLNTLGTAAVAEFWAALANESTHAQAALVALAGYDGWGPRTDRRAELPALSSQPLIDKIPQWWQQYPQLRPELLYLTVTLGKEYEGSVTWPKLAQYLGARLSGEDVEGFLRQAPGTIWHLRDLVHGLSDGWSRSKIMIPELERYLNNFNAAGGNDPSPYYTTERSVEFLCVAGTQQDLQALRSFLRSRMESHPSEKRSLDSFVTEPLKRLCPATPRKESSAAGKPGVVFGD